MKSERKALATPYGYVNATTDGKSAGSAAPARESWETSLE